MGNSVNIGFNFTVGDDTTTKLEGVGDDVLAKLGTRTKRRIGKHIGFDYSVWIQRLAQRIQKAARTRASFNKGSGTLWESIRSRVLKTSDDLEQVTRDTVFGSILVEMTAGHSFFQEYGFKPHGVYGRRVSAGVTPSMTIATWLSEFRGFSNVGGGSVINVRGKRVINPSGPAGGSRLKGHILGEAFNAVWRNAVRELEQVTLEAAAKGIKESFFSRIFRGKGS